MTHQEKMQGFMALQAARLEHRRQYAARQRAFIEAHMTLLGEDCFLDSSEADDRDCESFGLVYAERREGREIS